MPSLNSEKPNMKPVLMEQFLVFIVCFPKDSVGTSPPKNRVWSVWLKNHFLVNFVNKLLGSRMYDFDATDLT